MSRWATFYYDVIRNSVHDLRVHESEDTALKYFNVHCKDYFQVNISFKAKTLPATYGFPFRKYVGISAQEFKKEFGISIDEALKEAEQENKDGTR